MIGIWNQKQKIIYNRLLPYLVVQRMTMYATMLEYGYITWISLLKLLNEFIILFQREVSSSSFWFGSLNFVEWEKYTDYYYYTVHNDNNFNGKGCSFLWFIIQLHSALALINCNQVFIVIWLILILLNKF